MSAYPKTEHERRISPSELQARVQDLFERCGMGGNDAQLLADSLVAADVRGIHSHGVLRVPDYVEKLLAGGVDPNGRPTLVSDRAAAIVVDGGNSMGQIGAWFAMGLAIERAKATNVAVAAVRGSNHCGAMFHYAMRALPEDMIGIAMTNALPTMAPWGGKDKIVGINPLAVAIPSQDEPPVVLDAAFSYSSHGKIRVYRQKGEPIPATWAYDSDGLPTTDAAKAIEGLLQPIGEYKGVGLAIVSGVLSTLLSGASYGSESGNMAEGAKAGHDGHVFIAINVAGFEDVARFKSRVDGIVQEIRGSARAVGTSRLYAPGGLEAETEASYRREGIPLNEMTWEGLECASRRVSP